MAEREMMTGQSFRSRRGRLRLRILQTAARVFPIPHVSRLGLPAAPRVLFVRPDHLGDVLLTTPAIASLRTALPEAHVTALLGPWSADLLRSNPGVDDVMSCPFPGFDRGDSSERPHPYGLLVREARRLAKGRFDVALILRPDAWWAALLCRLAGIPRRYGFDVPEVRPFLTDAIPRSPIGHVAVESGRLVETFTGRPADLGHTAVFPSPEDESVAAWLFARSVRPAAVAVHPGSGASTKRWNDLAIVEAADAIAARLDAEIFFTAGPGEVVLAERLAASAREPNRVISGLAPLQLAALLRRCRVALGPDSGVLHLAVAVRTPTVHLFGPADARQFGPWGWANRHAVVASRFDCAPCGYLNHAPQDLPYHRCVFDIPVESVVEAALRVAGKS